MVVISSQDRKANRNPRIALAVAAAAPNGTNV
jgi:hypothetical protein